MVVFDKATDSRSFTPSMKPRVSKDRQRTMRQEGIHQIKTDETSTKEKIKILEGFRRQIERESLSRFGLSLRIATREGKFLSPTET